MEIDIGGFHLDFADPRQEALFNEMKSLADPETSVVLLWVKPKEEGSTVMCFSNDQEFTAWILVTALHSILDQEYKNKNVTIDELFAKVEAKKQRNQISKIEVQAQFNDIASKLKLGEVTQP